MPQRNRQRHAAAAGKNGEGSAILWERLRWSCLAAATALLVVAPLMPSEAVTSFGVNAPVTMGWMLLLVGWACSLLFQPARGWRWDWSDAWLFSLIAWHTFVGVMTLYTGVPRPALNVVWLWIGYASSYWLLRQWIDSEVEKRALIAVMLALGTVLAGHGLYQYFYSNPQTRAEYLRDPEAVMRKAGVVVRPGTPEADQFRNRIESKEPLASFSLTNSLAGYLAPWLVIAGGIALTIFGRKSLPLSTGVGVVAAIAIMATCLFLTKSRTGVLATAAGVTLLLGMLRGSSVRISWQVVAVLLIGVAGIVGLVVATRGLDRLVLTEAPKSLQYRLEYWVSTVHMIAEHPWLGVGPGNFQDWYSRYKLPQASETVADPHNYLLEMTATAGLPALILFVGWQLMLARRIVGGSDTDSKPEPAQPLANATSRWAIYAGFALGLLLVFPLDLLVGFVPEGVEPLGGLPVAWIVGGPLAALVLAALDRWVVEGEFSASLAGLGLVTLAINLLAAGSLLFGGVMTTAWVLAACATSNGKLETTRLPSRNAHWVTLCFACVVAFLAHQTLYNPILTSQLGEAEFDEARTHSQRSQAKAALQKWIAADPWSAEPWKDLADIELERWLMNGDHDDGKAFHAAVKRVVQLSPISPRQSEQQAQWYWIAWRRKQDTVCRDLAVSAWREAVKRYPNSAFLRAQLAYVLAEVGELQAAKEQAERAQALDAQNPHREQKLVNRKVFDPTPGEESPYRSESAVESLEAILKR